MMSLSIPPSIHVSVNLSEGQHKVCQLREDRKTHTSVRQQWLHLLLIMGTEHTSESFQMSLTIADLEQLQSEHPDWQMELLDGSILVMGPSDYESEEIGTRLSTFLNNWVMPRRLGRVTGSSAGFILPNRETEDANNGEEEPRNLRAPDVSFVRADRLKKTKRDFVKLVPDLMVEVKSKTDRVKPLVEKIELFLEFGTVVGILIDPDKRTVSVYRLNQSAVVLKDSNTLTVPELLPGWELAVSQLWPPEFE